jgi:hypothetical protein
MLTIVNDHHLCQGILSGMIGANKKSCLKMAFGVEGERRWMQYRRRDAIRGWRLEDG